MTVKLQELILTTDKSTQVVDDRTRIIRQSEKGIVLPVTIVDENNAPYDLTDISIAFNEIKKGEKIVIDTGDPSNDYNGKIIKTDPKNGRFEYTLQRQVYAADGTAYFSLQKGSEIVDTTKDFYFKVIPAPVIYLPNDNYASSMEAELNRLKAEAKKVANMIEGYGDDVQAQVDKIGKTASDEFAKSLQGIKDQLNTYVQGLTDYNNEFEQLKQGWNSDFNQDQESLHKDYEAWKQQQLDSFNSQIQPIRDALADSQTKADQITQETVDATAKVDKLMKDLEGYDFTQFIKPSDLDNYYNKSEVDGLVANAGKVKTVNGNQPDSNGNVQVAMPDLSGYAKTENLYSKSDIDSKLASAGKVKGAKVNGGELVNPDTDGVLNLTVPNPDLSDYAKTQSVTDLTNSVTDITNRVTKLEQNPGLQLKKADSQSDAETKSKTDSALYYWT